MVVMVEEEVAVLVGRGGGGGGGNCQIQTENIKSNMTTQWRHLVQQRKSGVSVDGRAFACDSNTNAGKGR